MPPLPKRRLSKGRSARRRSHLALQAVKLISCPHCHQLRPSHHVCPNCGYYKGEGVVKQKEAKKKSK